jgi:hypothetical protein
MAGTKLYRHQTLNVVFTSVKYSLLTGDTVCHVGIFDASWEMAPL